MPLKHKIEKLEDVAEGVRGFYEASNGAFFLQVEGLVPKSQLDEFRNNNITLMRERDDLLAKYKDVDLVKYRELLATAGKTPKEIDDAVAARVSQMRTEHEAAITERDTKITTLSGQLNTVLVDGTLRTEAGKSGALAGALDDIVLRGRGVFQTQDGKLIARNDKGEPMYDKDGTSPLAVTSWLKDLKKSAPHLFEGMRGAGGGGNNGGAGGGAMDVSKMSATQKIAFGLSQQANGQS
jgi:hypothetical protein